MTISKFDENGRKFSKMIENTVGKGEIAHYEQFLFFPQCFQEIVLQLNKNKSLFKSVSKDRSKLH